MRASPKYLLLLCMAANSLAQAAEPSPGNDFNLIVEGRLPDAVRLHVSLESKDPEARAIRVPVSRDSVLAGIYVPPGEFAMAYLEAEDSDGMAVYRGKAEITAGGEFAAPQVVKLESVRGDEPAELTLASHRLVLEFAAIGKGKEPKTRATARLFDANGLAVDMRPEEFKWEIDDPWIRENAMPCKGANGPPPACIEFGPVLKGFSIERFGACYRGICGRSPPPAKPPVWKMVSAGLDDHACALKLDGSAWCWGDGRHGELGVIVPDNCFQTFFDPRLERRPVACAPTPVQVQCPNGPCDFVDITAGADHTCAIDRSQDAWCWGSNFMGELGDGTDDNGDPNPMPRRVNGGLKFTAISAGLHFTCGLTAPDHDVYCWGHNRNAVVPGTPDTIVREPRNVNLLRNASSLDAGWIHVCAGVDFGGLYCWGSNAQHMLGSDAFQEAPQCGNCPAFPRLMQFADIPAIAGQEIDLFSAGMNGTCAQLTLGGAIECWGDPKPAMSPRTGLVQLSRGGDHACSLASNLVLCAGNGKMGQLGDGLEDPGDRGPVAPLAPPVQYTQISAGGTFTCAIAVGDRLYCWGANQMASLGNDQPGDIGQDFPSLVPVRVAIN